MPLWEEEAFSLCEQLESIPPTYAGTEATRVIARTLYAHDTPVTAIIMVKNVDWTTKSTARMAWPSVSSYSLPKSSDTAS